MRYYCSDNRVMLTSKPSNIGFSNNFTPPQAYEQLMKKLTVLIKRSVLRLHDRRKSWGIMWETKQFAVTSQMRIKQLREVQHLCIIGKLGDKRIALISTYNSC